MSVELMSCKEAMEALEGSYELRKSPEPVRRESWKAGHFLGREDRKITMNHRYEQLPGEWTPSDEDKDATDWELFCKDQPCPT